MSIASSCRALAAAFAFASFVGHVCAQSISVGSGGSLSVGQTTTVSFEDQGRANQTVVITITSSWPNPVSESHVVTLDVDGRGSFSWTVPNWSKAYFNGPGATEVSVPVL